MILASCSILIDSLVGPEDDSLCKEPPIELTYFLPKMACLMRETDPPKDFVAENVSEPKDIIYLGKEQRETRGRQRECFKKLQQ